MGGAPPSCSSEQMVSGNSRGRQRGLLCHYAARCGYTTMETITGMGHIQKWLVGWLLRSESANVSGDGVHSSTSRNVRRLRDETQDETTLTISPTIGTGARKRRKLPISPVYT